MLYEVIIFIIPISYPHVNLCLPKDFLICSNLIQLNPGKLKLEGVEYPSPPSCLTRYMKCIILKAVRRFFHQDSEPHRSLYPAITCLCDMHGQVPFAPLGCDYFRWSLSPSAACSTRCRTGYFFYL